MNSIIYYRVGLAIMYPLLFIFVLLVFWIIYKFYIKVSFRVIFQNFLVSVSIVLFYFMSNIFTTTVEFLNCTEIDGNYYISNFLIEKCNDNERYSFWKYNVIWPAFLIFTILFPLILFVYMFRHRKNLFDERVRVNVAFLLNGYSAETFYW